MCYELWRLNPCVAILSKYLKQLFESGEVTIHPGIKLEVDPEVDRILINADRVQRYTLAGDPPSLCERTAKWAAILYAQACGFVVHRDASPEAVTAALLQAPPVARCAAVDYSADLIFQYLPDLLKLSRRVSPDDPLVGALSAMARAWPLSSPGCGISDCESIDPFWEDRSLRMLYVDRVLQRNDFARADDPRVRVAIAEVLGAHAELSPRGAELALEPGVAK